MSGPWQKNNGRIPKQVREGVDIEAIHRDGTVIFSDDMEHEDLWRPERSGGGAKDIVQWRVR